MIQVILDIELVEPERRVEGRPGGWSERGAEEGDYEVGSIRLARLYYNVLRVEEG